VSVLAFAPAGQQPSPDIACVIATCVQRMLQLDRLPVATSVVQLSPSSQLVGHAMAPLLSQVSLASMCPSPQLPEQSLSLLVLQPSGQQPSPERQFLIGL
jgi:hypothetical protein